MRNILKMRKAVEIFKKLGEKGPKDEDGQGEKGPKLRKARESNDH